MNILIGGAWPYANGSLHIGHLAGLLPGDIIARYYRLKGDTVFYVSGSDCHGTPVALRAREEDRSPQEISDRYHDEFCRCFERLGFSWDLYGKTSSSRHMDFVQEFHRKMYQREYVEERWSPQALCPQCRRVLTDRFVNGLCPHCGQNARGDQCEACGTVLAPEELIDPHCSACGGSVTFRQTKHLFITLTKLAEELTAFLKAHPHWRKNALAFTRRYLDEGLRDRAITRDLDWGIDVPLAGYEDKKIYIWAENVLGYLSMSQVVAQERGQSYEALWGEHSRHYYVHGKDNIPFHTIILPALLLANGGAWHLPDHIISSEYLTLEGRKISTSQNWAIWVKDIAERYDPDSIRYFLTTNGPEKRDTDFSWREYVNSHNGELVGAWGNLVNRTLAFIHRFLDGVIPEGAVNEAVVRRIDAAYPQIGALIEIGHLKEAVDSLFALTRFGNKLFDGEEPWITRQSDPFRCGGTLLSCVHLIANLSILLEPFLPFSSGKIKGWLGLRDAWQRQTVVPGAVIPPPQLLFAPLDQSVVEIEQKRLREAAKK